MIAFPSMALIFIVILVFLPGRVKGWRVWCLVPLENGLDHNRVSPLLPLIETEMPVWLHIWCDCVVSLILKCMPTIYICKWRSFSSKVLRLK